jgi:uncharacterized protein YciI
VKYVLLYESGGDIATRAPAHFPAHKAWYEEFYRRGELLMIGPFASPREGAMAVFTTRAAAEEFVGGDPFVRNGLVSSWFIREWNEALVPDAAVTGGGG